MGDDAYFIYRPEALDKMPPEQMGMIMSRMVARKNTMSMTKAARQKILDRALVRRAVFFILLFLIFVLSFIAIPSYVVVVVVFLCVRPFFFVPYFN